MKKFAFIALLIFSAFGFPVKSQDQVTWRKYYAYVDTAEIAIVDSMYSKALSFYEKAFRLVDHPFGKDYYNAALCADHLKKPKLAVLYMTKLAEKGLDIKYFEDNPYLSNVKQSRQWQQFVKKYPACREKYLKDTVAIALRKEFERMHERDQYYAMRKYESGYEDSVFFVNYKHIQRLIEITNKYGFPGENITGIAELPYNNIYFLILLHFQQSKAYFNHPNFSARKETCLKNGIDYNKIDLISLLKKAALEGKFHPSSIASLSFSHNTYGNCIMLQVDDTASMVNYAGHVKAKIDSARYEISLCSLEMHVKKGLYSQDKLDHFRRKLKTETPKEYASFLESSKKAQDYNFTFGLGSTFQNFFFRDRDPQHEHFSRILNGLQNRYE